MLTLLHRGVLCRTGNCLLPQALQYETLAIVCGKPSATVSLDSFQSGYINIKKGGLLSSSPLDKCRSEEQKNTQINAAKPVRSSILKLDNTDLFLNQNKELFNSGLCFNNKYTFSFSSTSPFSSEDPGPGQKPEKEKKPDLDSVAFDLTYELNNVFVKQSNWMLYHPHLVFEDRIRGKRYEGVVEYMKFINLVKILAHIKFVYVRFHVLNLTKHPDDGTIRVRWRIAGLGVLRVILRFFPDQMWKRGNMDKASPTWYDGYSIFYVGSDNKIYKHIADRRMEDQDKEKAVLNPVVEKLKKLKPQTQPSPVI